MLNVLSQQGIQERKERKEKRKKNAQMKRAHIHIVDY